MSRPLLAVEMLIGEDARRDRVTVATQQAFRASITPPVPVPFDEIDLAVADAEKALNLRSERGKNSVLQILDDIAVERLRSMNYEERGAE